VGLTDCSSNQITDGASLRKQTSPSSSPRRSWPIQTMLVWVRLKLPNLRK